MFQTKVVEKIETHFMLDNIFFFENLVFTARTSHVLQYGSCALHAGYLRLEMKSHNKQYLLLFHCNNGCVNAPQCYVLRTLPAFYSNVMPFLKCMVQSCGGSHLVADYLKQNFSTWAKQTNKQK